MDSTPAGTPGAAAGPQPGRAGAWRHDAAAGAQHATAAGRRRRAVHARRRRRGLPVATLVVAGAVGALAVTGVVPGTGRSQAANASATAGTTPTSPSSLPPAPAGFAGQVTGLYDEIYQANELLQQNSGGSIGTVSQLPSQTSFAQSMANLTPLALDELYQATQKNPQWATLPAKYQQLITQLQSPSAHIRKAAPSPAPAQQAVPQLKLSAHQATARSFPPPPPTGSFPAPPAAFVPSSPVGAYTPTSCPPGAPGGPSVAPGDSAIFAAQLTTDVAASVAGAVPDMILVVIAGEGTSIPDPAKYIAEAIQLAGVITLDTFNYVQAVANDCDTANRDGFLANIDNTTVNVYNLLTLVQNTLNNVENSVNTVAGQVGVLQQTADEQLVLGIEQALTAPLGSAPNVAYELPASLGGNLDSTPIGVQEVVTTTLNEAKAAGVPVNAAASQFLSMGNAALSAGNDQQAYADFQNAFQQAAQ
ncbi:MAG: hypothetical protein M0013_14235 [Actinomycetota bacterium]|nr:hypothetical protein [Actinomycetota bacterium]